MKENYIEIEIKQKKKEGDKLLFACYFEKIEQEKLAKIITFLNSESEIHTK